MGLEKEIISGKSKRKPYYGTKAEDATYRNHGSAKAGYFNRNHSNFKREIEATEKIKEIES